LCHAWSAHPAIEFLTRILGVTPRRPGFAEINIEPHRCGLSEAAGIVCTPRGNISVAWRAANSCFNLEVTAPIDSTLHVRLPGGERQIFAGGKFSMEGALP
jgi:alpha-L-rhamnosidase